MNSKQPVSYSATGNGIEARLQKTQRTLVGLFIFIILFPILWGIVRDAQTSIVKAVDIYDVKVISGTVLCPGDMLVFTYQLNARGSGTLVRDLTLWKMDPPKTIVFSEERRFILNEPIHQNLQEAWVVPDRFYNYDTATVDMIPPGNYSRLISISSPTLSTAQDTERVDFTIERPELCNPS